MKSVDMTPDQVEQEMLHLEGIIGQIRGRQAQLIDEAIRMKLPVSDGSRNAVDWVSTRIDVTHSTAADLLTLAKSLDFDDLASGEVSTDRAVARRKLAKAGASKETLEESDRLSITGVKRLIANHRRTARRDEREAFERRHLTFRPNSDHSTTSISGELPGIDGRMVEEALTRIADDLPRKPAGGGSRRQRLADALVKLCLGDQAASNSGPVSTTIVDARLAAPSNGESGVSVLSGPTVGPQAMEEILCSGIMEVIALTADGIPLGIGTTSPKIPPKLRRFVLARDGGCTADGCRSTYRLEPHHIRPAGEGGPTDPENLTTLCWFHHHVVIHGRGYRIDPDSLSQRIRFLPPKADPRAPP